VPFTLVHGGKCRTEDKLEIQTIQKSNDTEHSKTKLPWFIKHFRPALDNSHSTEPCHRNVANVQFSSVQCVNLM